MFNTWSNAYPYCYKSISRDSVAPARPPEASSTQLPPLGRAPGGNTWHLFLCALGVLFFCVRHIFTFYGLAPFFTDVSAFAFIFVWTFPSLSLFFSFDKTLNNLCKWKSPTTQKQYPPPQIDLNARALSHSLSFSLSLSLATTTTPLLFVWSAHVRSLLLSSSSSRFYNTYTYKHVFRFCYCCCSRSDAQQNHTFCGRRRE